MKVPQKTIPLPRSRIKLMRFTRIAHVWPSNVTPFAGSCWQFWRVQDRMSILT